MDKHIVLSLEEKIQVVKKAVEALIRAGDIPRSTCCLVNDTAFSLYGCDVAATRLTEDYRLYTGARYFESGFFSISTTEWLDTPKWQKARIRLAAMDKFLVHLESLRENV